jgi:general secretion pathway protein C
VTDDQNNNFTPETPESPESGEMPESDSPTSSFVHSMREKTGSILAKFRFARKKQDSEPALDEPYPLADGVNNIEQEEPTSEISMAGAPSIRGESSSPSARRMELLNVVEWVSQSLQSRGYAFYGKLFTLIVCCYFLADVLALMAGKYIPEPPVVRSSRVTNVAHRVKSIDDYNPIFARNLFNRKGLIPGEENPSGPADLGGAPVRTSLPFNLVGTLILKDEIRSIATIEDKSASMVYPVRIDEEIPSKARILKIEPRKVIFVNTQSGRREFVDLPEDAISSARISIGGGGTTSKSPGIEQVSDNQFNISRSEVDKALGDFNRVLTEARAVPNFENGVPNGYKLFQIVPGSIYDKLGLKNGDTIVGVDGQPINDPAKAFELLGKLKEGASHMELAVKKPDGKTSTKVYDIH